MLLVSAVKFLELFKTNHCESICQGCSLVLVWFNTVLAFLQDLPVSAWLLVFLVGFARQAQLPVRLSLPCWRRLWLVLPVSALLSVSLVRFCPAQLSCRTCWNFFSSAKICCLRRAFLVQFSCQNCPAHTYLVLVFCSVCTWAGEVM